MSVNLMQVKLDSRTVEVPKLKLSQYAEVLDVLDKIPQILGQMTGKTNDELFAELPKLIARGLPEVITILAIATPLTEEQVDALGLDEATELLKAVFEVNKIGRVAENLKNLFNQKSSQPTNGSTAPSTSSPQSTDGVNQKSSTSTQMNSTNSTT